MSVDSRDVLLVVDDDQQCRDQLVKCFSHREVVQAEDRESTIAQLRRHEPTVVTLDLGLRDPRGHGPEGLRTLEDILSLAPGTKVIAVVDKGDRALATQAIGLGAYDFFEKPIDDHLVPVVSRGFRVAELERECRRQAEGKPPSAIEGLITRDPRMLKVCREIERLAGTTDTVLLTGEVGTGKQLLARALHRLSPRDGQRLVEVNCAALPASQHETELFGVETGGNGEPRRASPGKLELAHGGTLFLDEVAELAPAVQARLLQFLESGTVRRVGGERDIAVDVRVICATTRDLRDRAREGAFRDDVLYRLAELEVRIPPLRERAGDAALLAHAFVRRFGLQRSRDRMTLSESALSAIEMHGWPGNVRELENGIRRAVLVAEGRAITASDLGLEARDDHASLNLRRVRDEAERQAVLKVMARSDGNVARAAEMLGISRPTLYDLLNRFGLR